ncbi:MAG TPA: amino acid permease [Vicinamibacterales bacterium]|jgi:APA family basic amino acid/polyamine antiporter
MTVAAAAKRHDLRRILGVGFGLAVIVGATLGIGILRTPGLVAGQLGSPALILIVWVLGGLYTLIGAICFTELGTMLPQAGGYYVYARRAFGDRVGFAVGWSDWLTYCSVLGYISIGLAEFVAVLHPELSRWTTVIASVTLIAFVMLQWTGVRVSARFQEVTTAAKFVAFAALVSACLLFGQAGAAHSAALSTTTFGAVVLALQSVVITYGGWQSALYFTEEDRDPSRNLPRAMIGGVAAVIAIYLLVNLALLRVLPIARLAGSTLPAADAAQTIAGVRGADFITILSIVSLAPLLNAILMIGTRILFAMSRDGLMPSGAAAVNAGGTPTVSTIVTMVVALGLIATGTFQKLVALTSFFLAANYFVCSLALIVLRRREPRLPRPFRAWGYPASAWIVVVGAVAFLYGTLRADTRDALVALGLIAAGLAGRAMATRR